MDALISIVIPTYNRKAELCRLLESLIQQAYIKDHYEIVVVNDSVTMDEDIRNIVRDFNVSDPLVRYSLNKRKKGPSGSRNTGIQEAKGEIVFFIDDDCIADQNWLNNMMQEYIKYPEIGGAGGRGFSDPTQAKNYIIKYIEALKINLETETMLGRMETPCFATYNMSYKKDILMEVGGFCEDLTVGEDYDLKNRICSAGYKIAYVPNAIVYHHQRADIISYLRHDCFDRGKGYALYISNRKPLLMVFSIGMLIALVVSFIYFPTYSWILGIIFVVLLVAFSMRIRIYKRLKRVSPLYSVCFYLFYSLFELPLKFLGCFYGWLIMGIMKLSFHNRYGRD